MKEVTSRRPTISHTLTGQEPAVFVVATTATYVDAPLVSPSRGQQIHIEQNYLAHSRISHINFWML